MRKTSLDMVYRLAREDRRICFIGSDLGAGTLDAFKHEMPERFFLEGIAEQNLVGLAAGLALEGKIPYVNTIASFLTRRCFEQIVIDLCLHRANVRLIGNGGGLTYAPLGPTHQTIEDLAILRALPNLTVVAPADAREMARLMPLTVDHDGPIFIRLAKGYDPIVTPEEAPFAIGRAVPIAADGEALALTTGITLQFALEARRILAERGVGLAILHLPTIKPLDREAILDWAAAARAVVTIEEHSITGGLGSAVAEIIAEAAFNPTRPFRRIGLPDCFPEGYGSQAGLLEQYGVSTTSLVAAVEALLA